MSLRRKFDSSSGHSSPWQSGPRLACELVTSAGESWPVTEAVMNELRELVKRAEGLALAGQWGDEAVSANTRILELDDRISGAYTRLARCFREQGNWLAARTMYQQVLLFDSRNRMAANQLVVVAERLNTTTTLLTSGYTREEQVILGVGGWTRQSWTGCSIDSRC
jgi:hypothetical protein